jgi:hypothetical protein
MGLGHVLSKCGKAPLSITSFMACHPSVFEKGFNRGGGNPYIKLLSNQLMGHAVIVPVNFNVIINIDPGFFPFSILIATGWKPFKSRLVYGFKQSPAIGIELFEFAIVELC